MTIHYMYDYSCNIILYYFMTNTKPNLSHNKIWFGLAYLRNILRKQIILVGSKLEQYWPYNCTTNSNLWVTCVILSVYCIFLFPNFSNVLIMQFKSIIWSNLTTCAFILINHWWTRVYPLMTNILMIFRIGLQES